MCGRPAFWVHVVCLGHHGLPHLNHGGSTWPYNGNCQARGTRPCVLTPLCTLFWRPRNLDNTSCNNWSVASFYSWHVSSEVATGVFEPLFLPLIQCQIASTFPRTTGVTISCFDRLSPRWHAPQQHASLTERLPRLCQTILHGRLTFIAVYFLPSPCPWMLWTCPRCGRGSHRMQLPVRQFLGARSALAPQSPQHGVRDVDAPL